MSTRFIDLPGINKKVPLSAYIKAVRLGRKIPSACLRPA
jgi:hypothetical protein